MKYLSVLICLFMLLPTTALSAVSININTATLEQLDQIVGIGPKYGQAIISARPFSSLDDLLKVKGIGEKTLQKIKDQGLACVVCPAENSAASTSSVAILPTSSPASAPSPPSAPLVSPISPIPPVAPSPTAYPTNIFFSEILPAPEGADTENEWFELYNANNFAITLAGWQVKDTSGAIKTYTLPDNSHISANGFLVISRTKSKITLQNNGDGLVLLNPAGEVVDKVSYETAPSKQSFAKINNNWQWTNILTPGNVNQAPIKTKGQTEQNAATLPAGAENAENQVSLLQAQASNFAPKTLNVSRIISFIFAIIIALGSAIVVFFLKKQ